MSTKDIEIETKDFLKKSKKKLNACTEQEVAQQIKVYRKRWLILLLYILFTFGNKGQYFQYTMVLNVITKFYNVSTLAVKGTAMVFNISVPIMIYPCTLILNHWGFRYTMILISMSTSLGTWIKYIATSPDHYVLTMVGQTMVGAWQVMVISFPGALAARWFGPREVATATALGYAGIKLGMATLSLIMPIFVRMHENVEDIGDDLRSLLLLQAIYCSCVTVLIIIFFEDEPRLPPSKSRALQRLRRAEENQFWNSLKQLGRNKNYLFLWMSQNFIIGQFLALTSSLNALYMIHFKNGEKDVGKLAAVSFVSGTIGSVLFCKILDKTKKFKTITVALTVAVILSLVSIAVSFQMESRDAIFVIFVICGLFFYGYHPVTCDFSAEISYPVSESFSIAVLLVGNQIFISIMLAISDKLLLYYNDIVVYIFFFAVALVGFVLSILTNDVRRRQTAGNVDLIKSNEKC